MMEHAEHSPAAIREKAAGAVNCQSVTLPSGLTVLCRTMPGYSSVHAMYATNFGSVVREFTLNGKRIQLPAGTAHFLEHKMFESEQGDAFDLYAKTGAAANAFTSYDRTCYIFTATGMTDENLDILLNMVGHPWFTKETIAKEQGIIGQEIKMYDDSPDWRLLTALFRCLYKSHPIRDDIAGTTQSIAELTPELLYACTDAFYRPGNMVLSVAGNITLDQAVEACRRNGVYDAVEPPQVETIFPQEADTVQHKETTFTMPVNKPCFALGYKEAAINRGDTRMEVIADLLPDLICGGLTDLYRKLYDESLVNPEFSGDYLSTEGACIIAFTGESETPREVAQMVRDEIARLRQNGVDPELFPFRTWARLQKELLYSSPELLTHGDAQGDLSLRQALAEYLEEYRGVRCGPHQIVVGAGLEYLLGLLAPLLPGPAAVENPGYPRARQVLENNGISCCCLPVDEDGLSIRALSESGAAVCYVTPSHQFPTGVTMPAGRRAELLHWAARRPGQRYIIEDDYDSEFRFDTRPLPSLQGMAGADGPVVYLSTCSRSLAPGIRIAYMVLPEHLLPAWHAKYRLYSGTVSRFEQQTLARFITGGYFTRHLARERVAYKARRDALTAALNAAFAPGELTLTGLHTGLHLLAHLRNAPPDAALHAAARAQGVRLSLLSDYDLTGSGSTAPGTFVLGYGSLADDACPSVGETLKKLCTAARDSSLRV